MVRMKSTEKIARQLRREFGKKLTNRKTDKIFKKDSKDIATKLNQKAREIAKRNKRKVRDVQLEILDYFENSN